MAMNKKEIAAMEALQLALRQAVALRFTEDVALDVPIPQNSGELSKGWLPGYTRAEFGDIHPACSSYVHHGLNHTKTDIQGARMLYSTRLLALRATRRKLEQEAAAALAKIDAMIAGEIDRSEGA